jgi:hypothetical protein
MIDKLSYWGGVLASVWAIFLIVGIPIYIFGNWNKPPIPKPESVLRKEKRNRIKLVKTEIDSEDVRDGDMYDEN